jgi:hypothetical protein
MGVMGCFGTTDDADDAHVIVTATGPAHDADVQLADADVWIVPSLVGATNETPGHVSWTLLHPTTSAHALIRRTCTQEPEPFLWLNDPPNWTASGALATFHACGMPGEFYSTVELAYDGAQWIGVSATGAATLLPPQ